MRQLTLKHTKVFTKNLKGLGDPNTRFIVNQGGTRSSKTYSLCQLIIFYCLQNGNKVVSVVRKSFPSLRGSVMKDFFEIMNDLGLYSERNHKKVEHIYTFDNGSSVEFFSLDDAQKVRGRKRDVLWANEANELTFEDYTQLNMRTTEKLFFDFNPSDDEHWLYPIIDKPDCLFIHSTYKDNTFLPESLVKEIEDLIQVDQDYYNIYALGLPSKSTHTIYNHQKPYLEELPRYDDVILGLDFGFKHSTALIMCQFREDVCYVKELIYETHLTSEDLVDKMNKVFTENSLRKSQLVVADYARPEMIEELNRNGFNVQNAIKNVSEGIDAVKTYKLYYKQDNLNIAKEFKNYKWKSQGDRLLDEPIKMFDDAMDAMRYAILYHKKNKRSTGGYDFVTF